MADFNPAYKKAMDHEGAYSNDPDDKGAETYCGISRRWFPDWSGWIIIDGMKGHPDFPKILKDINALQNPVKEFYKTNFWNRIKGDQIKEQFIADELFDTVINMNPKKAPEFLQRALNCLNRNQALYPDLIVDGGIGPKTLGCLDKLNSEDVKLLFKMLNVLQGTHYIEEMERDHIQEKYCRGWFTRVEITIGVEK